jgi:hypothetical protein
MSSRPTKSTRRKVIILVGCLVFLVVLGLAHRQGLRSATSHRSSPTLTRTYPGLDLEDPSVSFETLRYTADKGGNDNTRAQAIVWLDQQTRTMQPLSPTQKSWMLEMLHTGGHPQWEKEYKFWLFNSALNTLHPGPNQEDLTCLLKHLAANDPDKTMRLYALQHIGLQRTTGRLAGEPARDMYAFLKEQLVRDPETAGTVIQLLVSWGDAGNATDFDVIARAVEIAAAPSRPVDVRVTALHASGVAALSLARKLAPDTSQPMVVRKASIALIGNYGAESDMADLNKLSAENFRLAQAAEPASQAIRQRNTKPDGPY